MSRAQAVEKRTEKLVFFAQRFKRGKAAPAPHRDFWPVFAIFHFRLHFPFFQPRKTSRREREQDDLAHTLRKPRFGQGNTRACPHLDGLFLHLHDSRATHDGIGCPQVLGMPQRVAVSSPENRAIFGMGSGGLHECPRCE